MDLTHLLHIYGYIVVFLITSITFSTGLVLAGFAAHEGYMSVYWVMVIACIGSFIFTEIYFIVSRFGFHKLIIRYPGLARKTEHIKTRFKSRAGVSTACLVFRFIPGFRMMMPFLLGPLKMSFLFFSLCNFIGSVVWAVFFTLLGFYFGTIADVFIKHMKHYQGYAIVIIVVIIGFCWLVRRYYKKSRRKF